jgi:3-hydroxyisobutyrate dehydrogenase-like beta-hydroxyacid dehydrogenase
MNTNEQQAQPRRVGLVGVGLMGSGIAQNIVKHGHQLTILDHPGNQPVGALLAAGATAVSDVTALAAEVDVLILCVTGTPQVEAVMLGKDGKGGALAGLRPGTVVIDCSTAVPDSTTKVAEAVQAKGGKFLDAPMTRTAKEAAEAGSICWSVAMPRCWPRACRCCAALPRTSRMWAASARAMR